MTTSSNWFDDPTVLTAEMKLAQTPRHAAPVIRGYDNIKELARGGQGIVFGAVQRSTKRPVAIKVLLDGDLATGVARRRFEREIDLIASLRHPNIVNVYDSGATDDGQLYLVMEFVEGVPLDQAWPGSKPDERPIREVLELMAATADAVQYAHQRGVIHRDLKPSNIRVDSKRQPHILDFGLAKVSANSAQAFATVDRATLSTSGQFMGSLPWASPEQAAGVPDAIDARADVYALGVMLYQLLAGRFPYDVSSGLKTALDNIITVEPERAHRVRPALGDEVATIVSKALSKDPARRYQSAGELARDIRHYLAGEPIEAKRDSAWYTARKSLRRYRVAVGAAAAIMFAVVIALVVSLSSLRDARRQRDIARSETTRATAVSKFVESMLSAADPGKTGKDIRVAEVLGPASSMADQTLRSQPEARVAVHGVLSAAYRNLQMYEEAEREARTAISIADAELQGKGEVTAKARTALAAALVDLGKLDEGLTQARLGLEIAIAADGAESEAAIEAQMAIASALDELQRFEESLPLKREIVERATRVLGPDSPNTLGAIGNLGRTLHHMGKLDEAIPLLEDVVGRSREVLGPDNIASIAPISTLVSCYGAKGDYKKSEPLLKDAWERLKRTYGPESNTTLIFANNYAVLLNNTGRSAEALPIALEVFAGLTKLFGPDHISVLRAMTLIGSAYGRSGDEDKQLDWQRRALEIADRTLGRKNQTTIYIRNNYASTLGALKRYPEAIEEFKAGIDDAEAAFGPDHSMPPSMRYNLAKNYSAAGMDDLALAQLEVASPRLLKSLGPNSDWTLDCVNAYAAALERRGKAEEANAWREKIKPPSPK